MKLYRSGEFQNFNKQHKNHLYIRAHALKNSLLNELVDNICHFLEKQKIIAHTGIFNILPKGK